MHSALRAAPRAVLVAALLTACAWRARADVPASAPIPPAAPPVQLDSIATDTLKAAILKDRTVTNAWLQKSPTSYLATVQRRDFGDRSSLTVGRAAKCDVRIDDPEVAPHHLTVTVVGDSFRVRADDDTAHFAVGDEWIRSATVAPSAIQIGRFTLRLSHQRFPAIIVFDPESKGFARYHGLKWFPVDFRYRYELPLTVNPNPDTVVILSTRSNQRRALRVGWFDFAVNGMPCRLEGTRLLEPGVGEDNIGIFFRDSTSGHETYGLGRYVEVEKQPDGRYVLDFNNSYNPACAVSDHYNCPIPPRENHLKVAIRVGEMDSHYH